MTVSAVQPTLLPVREPVRHPARYTDALLPVLARGLTGCRCILDPFAGTGKVHDLAPLLPGARIFGSELEWEWAAWRPGKTAVGNALSLPFADGTFDGICTSPTYGNRLADHAKYSKIWSRVTYTEHLARPLHPDNSGQLQWGPEYRQFHVDAWTEAWRVLAPGGRFVLNIKDHIRGGVVQPVTEWHIAALVSLGFSVLAHEHVATPSLRAGANAEARVGYESVVVLHKAGTVNKNS